MYIKIKGLFSIFLFTLILDIFLCSSVSAESVETSVKQNYDKVYEIDMDKEIEKAEIRLNEINNYLIIKETELENLKKEKKGLEEEIYRVENVANLTYEKIKKTNTEIENIRINLEEMYKEIKRLEIELEKREDAFRYRIQSSSKVNLYNYFEVILSSTSFSDLINNLNYIKIIIKADNNIIEEYIILSNNLVNKKKEKEKLLNDLEFKIEELKEIRESLLIKNENNKKNMSTFTSNYNNKFSNYMEIKLSYEDAKKLVYSLKNYKEISKKSKSNLLEKVGDYGLHPILELKRKELFDKSRSVGIEIIITQGYRSLLEQERLYSKGRTTPGSKVTNAKPGQSFHNFGMAFDVAFIDSTGKVTWNNLDQNKNKIDDWEEIGKIGENLQLEWGGRWTGLVDKPHFEYTFGKSLGEVQNIFLK